MWKVQPVRSDELREMQLEQGVESEATEGEWQGELHFQRRRQRRQKGGLGQVQLCQQGQGVQANAAGAVRAHKGGRWRRRKGQPKRERDPSTSTPTSPRGSTEQQLGDDAERGRGDGGGGVHLRLRPADVLVQIEEMRQQHVSDAEGSDGSTDGEGQWPPSMVGSSECSEPPERTEYPSSSESSDSEGERWEQAETGSAVPRTPFRPTKLRPTTRSGSGSSWRSYWRRYWGRLGCRGGCSDEAGTSDSGSETCEVRQEVHSRDGSGLRTVAEAQNLPTFESVWPT